MKFQRTTVLVLSSDPAFARELTESWPKGADAPEFVLLEQDLCRELRRDTFDLAIADASTDAKRESLCHALAATARPAIVISADGPSHGRIQGAIVELSRQHEMWPATAALVGREILRRSQAESRVRESERAQAVAEADATLGRYMIEMRHSVNNALTSVLGNAELLLLEPGLPAPVLAQADTIRNMAMRLNEVFQRFSSIEKELCVVARESGKHSSQTRAAAGAS
jgi:signal transduction histidine kinase